MNSNSLTARVSKRLQTEAVARSRRLPLRKNTILYEANSGRGAVCNPEAIFREILASPDLQHMKHVWVLDDDSFNDPIVDEFKQAKNVRFVRYKSLDYFHALGTSQYLINNATFPPELSKRPDQIYVNTWHGTPLKKMGYDVAGGGPDTRNIIRNFLSADFIISPNPFTTETMLRHAYRLDGVFPGKIAEVGYPRVDQQFADAAERSRIAAQLARAGVRIPAGTKVALYAPTWKGASYYDPLDEMAEVTAFVKDLQEELGAEWHVLVKVHQRVVEQAGTHTELLDRLVPNYVPANRALALADALVTDYSSIFYDYQALDRPICFFIPDLKNYSDYRGLYHETDSWPGPVVTTASEAAAALVRDAAVDLSEQRSEARSQYNPYDDGHAGRRVVDIVFRNGGHRILSDFSTDRTTLLIYPGGLLPNGITSSAVNLLNSIDHDRFDVSIAYSHNDKPSTHAFLESIDSRIRLLPRIGRFHTGKNPVEQIMGAEFAWGKTARSPRAQKDFREEWRRCFGDARFDHVIDFSGYGPLWAGILAAAPSGKKTIWQHNDMVSEVSKEIAGSTPHKRRLAQVFDLYNDFDTVVAVSPTLRDINAAGLQHHAPHTAFTHARNIIDGRSVLERSRPSFPDPVDLPPSNPETGLLSEIHRLITGYGSVDVSRAVEHQTLVTQFAGDGSGTSFLTIGRMSPEKNQARMVHAFAQVHAEDPNTRLIIVGDGPLRQNLETLVSSLGLSDAVVFTGQIPNPFPLYGSADCFVLSSDYEGQPMVILEALVVGLPIVSTRFASVTDALTSEQGTIVDRDVDALAQGMRSAIGTSAPRTEFDWVAYNREALDEFHLAIRSV